MDGLPVTNASEYILEVDKVWEAHVRRAPVTPATEPDSRCFFLMYDNVALNSVVCGPVFWLGNTAPTWDYCPLETVMSTDGRSLTAQPCSRFSADYPMSSADDLYRPDLLSPGDGATLAEPAAPVTDAAVVLSGLPDSHRITADLTLDKPLVFYTDPPTLPSSEDSKELPVEQCVTISRIIWSTHAGSGASAVAPPPGHQFLTLDVRPGCSTGPLVMVEGEDEVSWRLARTRFMIGTDTIRVPDWTGVGSYVVPAGVPEVAFLRSSLFGQPVNINLLTGEADSLTVGLNEGVVRGQVKNGAAVPTSPATGWWVNAGSAGRPFDARSANGPDAALVTFLPQFGAPPEGQRWLVVGISLDSRLTSTMQEQRAAGGTAVVTAVARVNREEIEAMVVEQLDNAAAHLQRDLTIVVPVPWDTAGAELILTETLSGWRDLDGLGVEIPASSVTITSRVTF